MIRLGGPVFMGLEDPAANVRAHRDLGYTAAYVLDLPSGVSARDVEKAFHADDVTIAEVGAWRNMIAPDMAKRRSNFDYVCSRLALADEIGARCCVNYLGTFDPYSDYGPHPNNLTPETFDLAVETIRAVIDAVKPRRAKFALEMMQWMPPDSVDNYVALIHAIDRPGFGAHLDPVNIILTPRQYYDTGALIRECFEKLGPWIVGCHAKDIRLRNELALHFDETPPGLGNLDYAVYLSELGRLPGDHTLMLEHLSTPEEYAAARDRLHEIGRAYGVDILSP